MPGIPRWFTEFGAGHASSYIDRFARLAAEGADLAGEARLLDTLVARQSRILDAGCGTGRVGAELHNRGHTIIGVDVDPALIAAACATHSGPRWIVGDLSELALDEQPFDAAVLAGNVLVFVAPGSAGEVLRRVSEHVRADGVVVAGFALDRDYSLDAFDRDCSAAGLSLEHRFATWDLRPWRADSDWAVSVLRR